MNMPRLAVTKLAHAAICLDHMSVFVFVCILTLENDDTAS